MFRNFWSVAFVLGGTSCRVLHTMFCFTFIWVCLHTPKFAILTWKTDLSSVDGVLAILFLDRSIFWSLHSYPFFLPDILFHAGRQKGWQEEALRAANRNCFDQFSPLQKTIVWKCLETVDSLRCPESHHLFVMFFFRISQLVFRRLISNLLLY